MKKAILSAIVMIFIFGLAIPIALADETIISNKLILVTKSIEKSQLNVGDSIKVSATFKALQAGDYVLESFWQSVSLFSILPVQISQNDCDLINGVAENPQFRNQKVHFETNEQKTVQFIFPALTFAGRYNVWLDAVTACRSSTYLVKNTLAGVIDVKSSSVTTVTTTGTSTVGSTTTTIEGTLVGGKLELVSSKVEKSQLKVGDSQTVTATFRAKQAGVYVLESFWQSVAPGVFSVQAITINECDILNNAIQNPQFRNQKIVFALNEEKTVQFIFPALTFAGDYLAYIDAVEDCRSSAYLVPNTKVSGFHVQPNEPVNPYQCTKPNGADCVPPITSRIDGSGPSTECKSGWCEDIVSDGIITTESLNTIGGRCADAGTYGDGSVVFGSQAAQACVDLGTTRSGFDQFLSGLASYFKLGSAGGIYNLGIILLIIVILIIVVRAIFGSRK